MNIKTMSTMIATVALCGVMVAPANAQRSYQNRDRIQRTWQVRSLVDTAERSSNAFRAAVERRDRETNTRNRAGTTNRERFFNELTPHVQRMDEAFERLRNVADNNRPRSGRDEMTMVLNRARIVDRYFSGNSFGWDNDRYNNGRDNNGRNNNGRYNNRRDDRYSYTRSTNLDAAWRDLRRDINALARAYNMTPLTGSRGW